MGSVSDFIFDVFRSSSVFVWIAKFDFDVYIESKHVTVDTQRWFGLDL